MATELTQEVSERLSSDEYCWLTTVAKSGQPVPKLTWFLLDGTDLIVFSRPEAAKVAHVRRHPQVSLNLDSDGSGAGIIVIGGQATIDAEGVDLRANKSFWDKYSGTAEQFGMTAALAAYSTRIRISIDKVWTTPAPPTEG